jgi:hypothetical protein
VQDVSFLEKHLACFVNNRSGMVQSNLNLAFQDITEKIAVVPVAYRIHGAGRDRHHRRFQFIAFQVDIGEPFAANGLKLKWIGGSIGFGMLVLRDGTD